VVSLFGYPDGASVRGVVDVTASARLALAARTYNQAGEAATFGQGMPALTEEDAIPEGGMGCLPGLKEGEGFRTNLGLVNLGLGSASVRVRLYAHGIQVGDERVVDLPGRAWVQIDRVLVDLGAGEQELAFATVEPISTGAQVWAYASVVDNTTGDPTTIAVIVP